MKKESLFAGVVLLVMLTSAGAKQKGEEYFPLSDEASWKYSVATSKKSIPDGPGMKGEMVMRIDGEKTLNCNKYFKVLVTSTVPLIQKPVYFYRKTKEGIFFVCEAIFEIVYRRILRPAASE